MDDEKEVYMEQGRRLDCRMEVWRREIRGRAIVTEDSSDTTVDFDEEDEQLLLIDPIHDQEDAGPSNTAKTLPPTASVEAFSFFSRREICFTSNRNCFRDYHFR
ncbi:hypothetical protein ATANTOWER_021295 [Ataeniobius toweri]|uniref:Uncharacterized protein n=1 Tax=Ataeniobius toweri TaxID=208326 RepID=A0ABU7A8Z9_9TELE|nr:hypothetical protein [Ataeniobius toweri]